MLPLKKNIILIILVKGQITYNQSLVKESLFYARRKLFIDSSQNSTEIRNVLLGHQKTRLSLEKQGKRVCASPSQT